MQVCSYMEVCKYESMLIYAFMQACKYASMRVCKYESMRYTNKSEAIYMSSIAAFFQILKSQLLKMLLSHTILNGFWSKFEF